MSHRAPKVTALTARDRIQDSGSMVQYLMQSFVFSTNQNELAIHPGPVLPPGLDGSHIGLVIADKISCLPKV